MSNSQAFPTSAKIKALAALVTGGTYKAALFLASASLGAATTAYSSTGEVSGTGYTAGGVSAGSFASVTSSGTTAYSTPSADIDFGTVTLGTAFDCALIYNTADSNSAVGVFTFGSQTVTAGDFVLKVPTNDSTNGLMRIS